MVNNGRCAEVQVGSGSESSNNDGVAIESGVGGGACARWASAGGAVGVWTRRGIATGWVGDGDGRRSTVDGRREAGTEHRQQDWWTDRRGRCDAQRGKPIGGGWRVGDPCLGVVAAATTPPRPRPD